MPPYAQPHPQGHPVPRFLPYRRLITCLITLALSACAVNPYPSQSLTQGTLNSRAEIARRYQVDTRWWQRFHDPVLNRLIEEALANNTNLRKSVLAAEQARLAANAGGANLAPSLSGSLNAAANQNPGNSGSTQTYSAQVGLSYELDLWGRVRASVAAQEQSFHASEQDLEVAKLSLVNSVADVYLHLAYLNEAHALTTQNRARYQDILHQAQARHAAGKVSALAVVNARQSLQNAETALNQLAQQRTADEHSLRNLLNLRPEAPLPAVHTRISDLPAPGVNLNIPLAVLSARPDLAAAEHRLQAAWFNRQSQERAWYPTITLNAALNSGSSRAGQILQFPLGSAGIGISLPLLDAPKLHWQNKQSQAAFEAAKVDFEAALTGALNEVATGYRQYRLAGQALSLAQSQYQDSTRNSRYYEARYRWGANPLSDWLSARAAEDDAAQALANSRYLALKAQLSIYQAMAGRFEEAAPKAP